MRTEILVIVMMGLSLCAPARAAYSDGQVTGMAAHQSQAERVSVLKVEGMT